MELMNYSPDSHDTESITLSFVCTKFESEQIDKAAEILLKKYQTFADSIYSNAKISTSDSDKMTEVD